MGGFIKSVATIILILSIIGSFVLGNTYATVVESSYSYRSTRTYNWALAITSAILSVIPFCLLYAVGCVLDLLTEIRDGIKEGNTAPAWASSIVEQLKTAPQVEATIPEPEPEPPAPQEPVAVENDRPVYEIDRSTEVITCPSCGLCQKSNRDFCFRCEAIFLSEGYQ